VKLLFDENLSPKLALALADIFPESTHVHHAGLGRAADREVWDYAHQNSYVLVSKDSDFHELSLLYGYPPKVVWIKRGNCSNNQIELILRNKAVHIETMVTDPEAAFLLLL
jgi:predicted nuclease of predicted toxin-antitoxin system